MNPIFLFDLPARFADLVPRWLTRVLVALVIIALTVGVRMALEVLVSDVVIFPLIFPAIAVGTLLAGGTAGILVLVGSELLAWYFLLPVKNSFAFASTGNAVSLVLVTLSALMVWTVTERFRRFALQRADQERQREQQHELLQQRDASLRQTRDNLAAIWRASSEGLTLCHAIRDAAGHVVDYQVLEVNDAHRLLTGASRDCMLGMPVSQIAPPVNPLWFSSADTVLRTGEMQHFDVCSPVTGRWLNIRVSRVAADLFQQTFVDVTDRHLLDEQRQQMLKEMSHRVMNNFQMVASCLRIQSALVDGAAKAHLQAAENQVQVLGKLHSLLAYADHHEEVDVEAYLRQLCDQLRSIIDRPQDISLICFCEPLQLKVDKLVPLGLIVNELVTNAAKHAFPPPRQGVIEVRLQVAGTQCTLTVTDNGQGLDGEQAQRNAPSGLGSRLMQSFIKQIQGEMTTYFEGGLRQVLVFCR